MLDVRNVKEGRRLNFKVRPHLEGFISQEKYIAGRSRLLDQCDCIRNYAVLWSQRQKQTIPSAKQVLSAVSAERGQLKTPQAQN